MNEQKSFDKPSIALPDGWEWEEYNLGWVAQQTKTGKLVWIDVANDVLKSSGDAPFISKIPWDVIYALMQLAKEYALSIGKCNVYIGR